MAPRVERIEVAVESITHRRVALVMSVILILEKLVVVSVRVVVVDGTAA